MVGVGTMPSPRFPGRVYGIVWLVVIPWVTLTMAVLPKRLVWAKTSHGDLSQQLG